MKDTDSKGNTIGWVQGCLGSKNRDSDKITPDPRKILPPTKFSFVAVFYPVWNEKRSTVGRMERPFTRPCVYSDL